MFTLLESPSVGGSIAATWKILRNQKKCRMKKTKLRGTDFGRKILQKQTWKISGFAHLHIVALKLWPLLFALRSVGGRA